jgi:HK97 family phage major capsid protein
MDHPDVSARIEAALEESGALKQADGASLRRVVVAALSTPWAILPEKLEEIQAFMTLRMSGHLSDEQIQAAARQARTRRAATPSGVALISITGTIGKRMSMMSEMSGGTSIERLSAELDAAMEDSSIGHVVFDVDSPGGSVAGVGELSQKIHEARGRKPMTAVANDLMASAAYYIASAADEVVASPSSLVGSIGVLAMHLDVSRANAMLGVKPTLITAGRWKAEAVPHRPLSDDARDHMQEMVDDFYGQFISAVARNRGTTAQAVANGYGEGRVLTAERARAAGLIDRVATLEEVLAELGVSPKQLAQAHAEEDVELAAQEAFRVPAGSLAHPGIASPGELFLVATPRATLPATLTTSADAPAPATEDTADRGADASPDPNPEPAPEARETPMSTQDTAAQPAGAATDTVAETRAERIQDHEAEQHLAADVIALCGAHGLSATQADEYVRSGKSVREIGADINRRKREGLEAFTQPTVEMSSRQVQRYSLSKAILAEADGKREELGFEYEVHQELLKKLPGDYKPKGGLLIPTRIRLLDTMGEHGVHPGAQLRTSAASGGQTLVFTEAGDFIDLLRNRMKVAQLGATILSGLQGNVSFPRQTGAGTFEWVAEDPNSDQSDSELTLGQVALNPKEGQSTTAYTRRLLAQAVIDVDALVANDLALITALGIDLAAIAGTGANNQPTGILETDNIGDVALGADGGVPTFGSIVDLETAVADANADIGTMAYLTTAAMRGVLKKTPSLDNTANIPVWAGAEMNGYRAEVSNQVPRTLTKGASTTAHAIIFGVWSQLMIGYWGAYELVVDPYSKKKQGLIEVTSHQIVGLAIRHPESFAAIQDALVTAPAES